MSSLQWNSNPTCIARNVPSSLLTKSNKSKAAFVDDFHSHQTTTNLSAENAPGFSFHFCSKCSTHKCVLYYSAFFFSTTEKEVQGKAIPIPSFSRKWFYAYLMIRWDWHLLAHLYMMKPVTTNEHQLQSIWYIELTPVFLN